MCPGAMPPVAVNVVVLLATIVRVIGLIAKTEFTVIFAVNEFESESVNLTTTEEAVAGAVYVAPEKEPPPLTTLYV